MGESSGDVKESIFDLICALYALFSSCLCIDVHKGALCGRRATRENQCLGHCTFKLNLFLYGRVRASGIVVYMCTKYWERV